MMSHRRSASFFAACWALGLVLSAAIPSGVRGEPRPALETVSEGDVVKVEIEAPQALQRFADRLAVWDPKRMSGFARLLGIDRSDPNLPIPVRVVLVSEDAAAKLGAPSWVAGYARGDSGNVVLFPSRVPVYPYHSLQELLGHEVAHVLIYRAAGGHSLPRWFHEGLSMLAEEAWDWEDRSRVALAVLRRGRQNLSSLDARFGDPEQVARAYALAGAFVHDLVNQHGRDFPAELLEEVAAGADFDVAFELATGQSLATAEDSFWRRFTFWYRWLPFLTSSTALWLGIVVLALLAGRRRRQRIRLLREQWDLEEAWEAERQQRQATRGPVDSSTEPVN